MNQAFAMAPLPRALRSVLNPLRAVLNPPLSFANAESVLPVLEYQQEGVSVRFIDNTIKNVKGNFDLMLMRGARFEDGRMYYSRACLPEAVYKTTGECVDFNLFLSPRDDFFSK